MNEIQVYVEISDSSSDDSDDDPSYTDFEQTRSLLSKLSIENEPNEEAEEIDDDLDIVEPELDEVDEKSFKEVQKLIKDGKIGKLKVEQCKVYLRKNGLRLTGNKATLIQRINEHLEILEGGGEKKYPVDSFVMNCKGDACTGDVVLFEQNVYDMFNIASRSASGPSCGTRMVAGRIVKESYGAAKQQHTFTVEVLWSKGEKPLPPLHPLLIKGRNLYRLKTLRQKWENEEERRKMLAEKHLRGYIARTDREARIQEKENRKMVKANRVSKRESNRDQSHFGPTIPTKPLLQPQRYPENQANRPQHLGFSSKPVTGPQAQKPGSHVDHDKAKSQSEKYSTHSTCIDQTSQSFAGIRATNVIASTLYPGILKVPPMGNQQPPSQSCYNEFNLNLRDRHPLTSMPRPISPLRRQNGMNHRPTSPPRQYYENNSRQMSPPRMQNCENYYRPTGPLRGPNWVPHKPCRHYAKGRCHYGETCTFLHATRE